MNTGLSFVNCIVWRHFFVGIIGCFFFMWKWCSSIHCIEANRKEVYVITAIFTFTFTITIKILFFYDNSPLIHYTNVNIKYKTINIASNLSRLMKIIKLKIKIFFTGPGIKYVISKCSERSHYPLNQNSSALQWSFLLVLRCF